MLLPPGSKLDFYFEMDLQDVTQSYFNISIIKQYVRNMKGRRNFYILKSELFIDQQMGWVVFFFFNLVMVSVHYSSDNKPNS